MIKKTVSWIIKNYNGESWLLGDINSWMSLKHIIILTIFTFFLKLRYTSQKKIYYVSALTNNISNIYHSLYVISTYFLNETCTVVINSAV